ncbi:MAG: trypsin-like serine protease [Bdellovibrionota bacterium]
MALRLFVYLWIALASGFCQAGEGISLGSAPIPNGICKLILRQLGSDTFYLCSGTIVGKKVITAAHCLEGTVVDSISCTGTGDIQVASLDFRSGGYGDTAVIELKKDYLSDFRLPLANEKPAYGQQATRYYSYGYGGSPKKPSGEIDGFAIDDLKFDGDSFKLNHKSGAIYTGDSGGPLFFKGKNGNVLMGVNSGNASSGIFNLFSQASHFANLQPHLNWLELPEKPDRAILDRWIEAKIKPNFGFSRFKEIEPGLRKLDSSYQMHAVMSLLRKSGSITAGKINAIARITGAHRDALGHALGSSKPLTLEKYFISLGENASALADISLIAEMYSLSPDQKAVIKKFTLGLKEKLAAIAVENEFLEAKKLLATANSPREFLEVMKKHRGPNFTPIYAAEMDRFFQGLETVPTSDETIRFLEAGGNKAASIDDIISKFLASGRQTEEIHAFARQLSASEKDKLLIGALQNVRDRKEMLALLPSEKSADLKEAVKKSLKSRPELTYFGSRPSCQWLFQGIWGTGKSLN